MIKPSDLPATNPASSPALRQIEEHIDKAIQRHHAAGLPWPLVVPSTRSGWTETEIESVLATYRENGWSAWAGGRKAMCVIAPQHAATANQDDAALATPLVQRIDSTSTDYTVLQDAHAFARVAVDRLRRAPDFALTDGEREMRLCLVDNGAAWDSLHEAIASAYDRLQAR